MAAIPVNNKILEWARVSSNYSFDEVARKMNQTKKVIESWENGESSPTYIQLEKLAYQVFKRPIAIFFFPKPPIEDSPEKSFRTLPDYEIEELTPTILRLFRQAQARQINISELCKGENPANSKILDDVIVTLEADIKDLVKKVRRYLNIKLEEQKKWKTFKEALKNWRNALEENGIFVFKEAFKQEGISGFCLYDPKFPVIYINNSMPKTRQIFTIFHELSHLFFKTGGIDKIRDTFINNLSGELKGIEIFCNQFAANFLVPEDDFNLQIKGLRIDDASILNMSKTYKVSREVILRKLYDKGLVSGDYYRDRAEKWIKEAKEVLKKRKKEREGGDYYATKAVYLGSHYLNLVFSQFYRKNISIYQIADYLNVKVNKVSNLEVFLSE